MGQNKTSSHVNHGSKLICHAGVFLLLAAGRINAFKVTAKAMAETAS